MPNDLILCVDDEPVVLHTCSVAVSEVGFRVAEAENGAAGLEAFLRLKESICLVLLDIVLPGMFDGIELATKIREIEPSTKILMMTGYTEEIVAYAGRDRLPLIRKPFLPNELVKRIRSILADPDSAASRE